MTIGIFVSFWKSASGTETPSSGPIALGIDGGTSPSGKTNPLPGSYATTARIFGFFVAVIQPGPPLCECVTRIPGPILSQRADTASVMTGISNGPVLGVMERKY